MIKNIMRIFAVVVLSLILTIILSFIELYVEISPFEKVVLEEAFKLFPILLATKFLGCITFGMISGGVFGTIEGLLRQAEYGTFFPATLVMHVIGGMALGLSLYPYKKSKNPLFLMFIVVGFLIAVVFHFYYNVYGSVWFGFLSIFYL